ncbi:MAG: GIY-YIG nuclease family protein [Flavobacteriaceae bacterium]|jgi:hypothetical protein|nr:GIY-YIG nuclease family protein [Flavobacteriaceae bacterium]
MPKSLDEIFENDDFGLLDSEKNQSTLKSDEDRLIDSFEEINEFFEKYQREPSKNSMSEYTLFSRLNEFKSNEERKGVLKPFDRYNLLGEYKTKYTSIDDVLNDDVLSILDSEGDTSIFDFKYVSENTTREKADYIAQRKSLSEKDFQKYELMFKKVHKELKEGKRKFAEFKNAEKNLKEGNFYLVDGMLCYLEVSKAEEVVKEKDGVRIDGRTITIFENGTISNMLFRSLGKAILKNGKLVTNSDEGIEKELIKNSGVVMEERESGWIYILKSKSKNPLISNINNLYKIGFSTKPVNERIKNAQKEATYLFDEVELIASYKCFNMTTHNFEKLIHRFFAEVCLDIDLYNPENERYTPREWFIAPLNVIDEALNLIINGNIVNYVYDKKSQSIILKK